MNATQIYEHLVKESFLPATVSVDSVQRFIRFNDLKSARDPNLRDRRPMKRTNSARSGRRIPVTFPTSRKTVRPDAFTAS